MFKSLLRFIFFTIVAIFLTQCSPKLEQLPVKQVDVKKEVKDEKAIPEPEDDAFARFPEGVKESVHQRFLPTGTAFTGKKMVPPHWWVGMEDPSLELIIYDRLIKGYRVSVANKGIEIKQVKQAKNPNYLFVTLTIAPDVVPGPFKIVLTRGDDVRAYEYELKERPKGKRIMGLDNSDCIYLIMPDRFANGDPSNDSQKDMKQQGVDRAKVAFRHGGDLRGVIDKLDYLKDLGVTALWLNPVLENNQAYESYHGYAVTDHYKIDARFGTNEDYQELVEACHSRGMKVVMDIVHNHVGDQHWMIQDIPSEDWIHQYDEFTKTTYRATTLMDPYAATADRELMTDGWFDNHMPDLNQQNPHVAKFLLQNNIWWAEYAGHDAYRVDTYAYPDPEFTSDWGAAMQKAYPKLSIFGETWVHGVTVQAHFTQNNRLRKGGFNTNLPAVTDFQLHYGIMEALNRQQGWTEGISKVYYTLAKDFVYEDPYRNVLFLDNHDVSRYYATLGKDFNKYKSGIAMLLTMRGIPCLYYGTEMLLSGSGGAFGEGGRQDFPGGWKSDRDNKFKAKGRSLGEQQAFDYVQALLKYRAKTPALHRGQLTQFVPINDIYVYFRHDNQKTVMVITNTKNEAQQVATERFNERIDGYSSAMNVVTGEVIAELQQISIDRNSTLVLELR